MKDINPLKEKITYNRKKNIHTPIKLIGVCTFLLLTTIVYMFFFIEKPFKAPAVDPLKFPANAFGRVIEKEARKIICLSPTVTEAIISLPMEEQLIGVSDYCNTRGRDIKSFGTPLMPKTPEIIAQQPEYVIIQTPLEESDSIKLEQAGIKILTVGELNSIEGLKEVYRSLSALVWGEDIANIISENIISDFTTKLEMYEDALKTTEKKTVMLLFNTYGMVATKNTIESELLESFFILANKGEGYYAGTLAQLADSDPQVIITSQDITLDDLALMGFSETQAFTQKHIYTVPIKDFENASPRIIKYLSEIANEVYIDSLLPVADTDVIITQQP